jgi:MATE family multidrug resistance protein
LAQRTSYLGLAISLIVALTSFYLLRFLAAPMAGYYSDNAEVIELAAYLLSLASLYQFSDALQLAATGALRGFKETRSPLIVCFIAYWVVGIPSGHYMAEYQGFGASGYWLGILIGLSFAAVLLVRRLIRVTQNALAPTTA